MVHRLLNLDVMNTEETKLGSPEEHKHCTLLLNEGIQSRIAMVFPKIAPHTRGFQKDKS